LKSRIFGAIGLDDIGLTMRKVDVIAAYEKQLGENRPWL
jgi:hypothetical protein